MPVRNSTCATLPRPCGVRAFGSIAERVDRDEMVPALCDLGVPLAQGFVFAAPRPVRPEIFGELPQPFSLDEEPMRLRRAG